MRKRGDTTRSINLAVDILFNEKEVAIPPVSFQSSEEYLHYFRKKGKAYMDRVVFDPASHISREVQITLFDKVLSRLYSEHKGVKLEIDRLKGIIRLK